jgi:sulfide dehydrogenase [flavocytochrome c] flavoprotein chain
MSLMNQPLKSVAFTSALSEPSVLPVLHRRKLLNILLNTSLASSLWACSATKPRTSLSTPIDSSARDVPEAVLSLGHVVIVGGGFGGATAAKYLRLWGQGRIAVTLIERQAQFISCPMSNLVLGGSRNLSELTFSYDGLKKLGVNVIQGDVYAIDAIQKTLSVKLSKLPFTQGLNETLAYDRLILSPGVEFLFDAIEGFDARAQTSVMHAWKAGEQTLRLRQQLETMTDGGVVAISIPKSPYRCPPGPYERACQIAHYLKHYKPHSKVIVLDANEDVQSKKALFINEWNTTYAGIVEYRSRWELKRLNADLRTLESELGDTLVADVINIIPPMQAGKVAQLAGVMGVGARWCAVDWLTMESSSVKFIHVLGDAVQAAPGMPKSGHMANQHGKLAASSIVELMHGRTPQPLTLVNTCYSYVDDRRAMHVASVHRFDLEKRMPAPMKDAGGLSKTASDLEGGYAWAWAQTIWRDMLA